MVPRLVLTSPAVRCGYAAKLRQAPAVIVRASIVVNNGKSMFAVTHRIIFHIVVIAIVHKTVRHAEVKLRHYSGIFRDIGA